MSDTIEIEIRASQLRPGDVFELHRKRREAAGKPSPVGAGHVSIPFVGGGFAIIPRVRRLQVTVTAP